MRPQDMRELLGRRPFLPLRLHLSNGRTFDVRHPDQTIVLRSRLLLGVGGRNGFPDHLEHVVLVHITQVEELPTAAEAGGE